MQQISKYKVENLGVEEINILNSEDSQLVKSRTLGSIPFDENRHTVDLSFYDLHENYIETFYNISSFSVLGEVEGHKPYHITVDPENDALSRNYLGDVILKYEVFNDLFRENKSEVSELYVDSISADRTEIRAKSVYLSDNLLKKYADIVYDKVAGAQYFFEFYLNFFDQKLRVVAVNITTEVIGDSFYVTFKTYNPLPSNILEKSRFTVLERIGEPVKFKVIRYVEIVEDPIPYLKGPNFEARVLQGEQNTTEYLNYNQLFSFPVVNSYFDKFAGIGENSAVLGIDYENFGDFIHFSSAVERLQNFKYKMDLIEQYNNKIAENRKTSASLSSEPSTSRARTRLELEIQEVEKQIKGLISNFDHYERYLYFESGSHTWPKLNSIKPYENVSSSRIPDIEPEEGIEMSTYLLDNGADESVFDYKATTQWYNLLEEAEAFDNTNQDILVGAIPFAIRESEENEPYVMFVHMLGQHFDDIWVYIDNLSERYNNDNRPNFGISKDLIRDAIEHLGIDLTNANQNLNELFENFKIESGSTGFKKYYDFGLESPHIRKDEDNNPVLVSTYTGSWENEPVGEDLVPLTSSTGIPESEESFNNRIKNAEIRLYSSSIDQQPVQYETYIQEIYRRIYSNIPYLIKTKGTQRGLRALINCFGIPDDILEIEVLGGIKVDDPVKGYFGPLNWKTLAKDRVRVDNSGGLANYTFNSDKLSSTGERIEGAQGPWTDNLTGAGNIYTSGAVASEYTSVRKAVDSLYSDDSHEVNVGFNLTKEGNIYISKSLSLDWDYDDIVGDPRNHVENYGDAFAPTRQKVLPEKPVGHRPADIIRLVRYFDALLFRLLTNFIPAKAAVATGAIVDDNFLHRNRYRGVDLIAEDVTREGGFHIGTVTGSHGGVFRRTKWMNARFRRSGSEVIIYDPTSQSVHAGYEWTTLQDVRPEDMTGSGISGSWTIQLPVSKSGAYSDTRYNRYHATLDKGLVVAEDVFADQPKYNGEFSGSEFTVTDHFPELKNPYHKASQPLENFKVGFLFEGLPEPPTCEVTGNVQYLWDLFQFWTTLPASLSFVGSPEVSDNFTTDTETRKLYHIRANAVSPIKATAWNGNCSLAFGGWWRSKPGTAECLNNLPADYNNGYNYSDEVDISSTPRATRAFLTPRTDFTPNNLGDDYTFEARYYSNSEFSRGIRMKLRLEDWGSRSYGYGYWTSSEGGQNNYFWNPIKLYYSFYDCTGSVVQNPLLGDTYVKFTIKTGSQANDKIVRIVRIDPNESYGTEEGVVADLGIEDDPDLREQVKVENIEQFGIYEMNGCIGPFLLGAGNNKLFCDADWYDCYDLWHNINN